jgi:NMD protein affecting ribosome stability and mRNA decay
MSVAATTTTGEVVSIRTMVVAEVATITQVSTTGTVEVTPTSSMKVGRDSKGEMLPKETEVTTMLMVKNTDSSKTSIEDIEVVETQDTTKEVSKVGEALKT